VICHLLSRRLVESPLNRIKGSPPLQYQGNDQEAASPPTAPLAAWDLIFPLPKHTIEGWRHLYSTYAAILVGNRAITVVAVGMALQAIGRRPAILLSLRRCAGRRYGLPFNFSWPKNAQYNFALVASGSLIHASIQ